MITVTTEELRKDPAKVIRMSRDEPVYIIGDDGTRIIVSCPRVAPLCQRCDGTGVIDTGNNEYPCRCAEGDAATFNTTEWGRVDGAFIKSKWAEGR